MKAIATLAIACLLCFVAAGAENGIAPDKIVLGQSCALEGMASSLGQGMSLGLNVYFDHINKKGGINGRTVELISLNDGYEPFEAIKNSKELVSNRNVFLLIGEVGTPTSKVVLPFVNKEQVPFVAPFTGAELLRNPFSKWVVNVRGSYNQEMEKLAQYLVDQKGMKNIACFYQDDAYGKAGLSGIELALKKRGLKLAGTGTYQRNTMSVTEGLAKIKAVSPEAVVMVGAYNPCAAFIKYAKKVPELQNATFCNISFVGTEALLNALGEASEGCIVSQVTPYPWDKSLPLIKEYQSLMTKAGHADAIDFTTLEGFMAAKLFCKVMANIPGEPTRENFIKTLDKMGNIDLGGVVLSYGPNDHQGMDNIFLTAFHNNKIERITTGLNAR